MLQMYKGAINSPETIITNNISNTDTLIYVQDETKVPTDLPNLMVLGTGISAETIKVLSISGLAITVERAFQGTAKTWNAGTTIARNFTEYDYEALKSNVEELTENQGDLATLTTTDKANLVGAVNELVSQSAQLTNPNLLVNGDFQIWQRGTSFTAIQADKYTADRWMMLGSVDNSNKVDKVTEGLKITTLTRELYFRQITESPNMLGKQITVSCSVDGTVYKFSTIVSTDNAFINTHFGLFYSDYNSSTGRLAISFRIDTNKTITINWVKLELGSVATPFHPKSYAEELASSQRYYINKVFSAMYSSVYNSVSLAHRASISFPTEMRVSPTVKCYEYSTNAELLTEFISKNGFSAYKSGQVSFGYNRYTADAEIY